MLLSLHLCLQAFTVVTVFNAMTFALKVTPFSVKSLSEASVAMDRFRVQLPLPVPPQPQELTLICSRGLVYPSLRCGAQRLEKFHLAEDDDVVLQVD